MSGRRNRLAFWWSKLQERLWFKPTVMVVLSVVIALLSKTVETVAWSSLLPEIRRETVERLLEIMATSMLPVATFSVASMVSAYTSASRAATPRAFPLIVADDLSQNALSSFIGSFIFSIVALVALKNGYFEDAGYLALFIVTLLVFAVVVLTFVRWVDGIARLGRLGDTITKIERVTARALERHRQQPAFGGRVLRGDHAGGVAVRSKVTGYVQHMAMDVLQACAEDGEFRIVVDCYPGKFAAPSKALAWVEAVGGGDIDHERIRSAFIMGDGRTFSDDPRFGLIVLAEIASKALSPAVNDSGTAIAVVGTLVRMFCAWADPVEPAECSYDRVSVRPPTLNEMFDDAFSTLARDGADSVEVMVRLQKGLRILADLGDEDMHQAACLQARLALARAARRLELPEELEAVRAAAPAPIGHHPAEGGPASAV